MKLETLGHLWLLYISTSFWVLRTPKAVWNLHFQQKSWKNEKKARNLQQNLSKTRTKTFIKTHFTYEIKKAVFLGIKPSTSVLVQTQKNVFFAIFLLFFFSFLPLKCTQTLVEIYNNLSLHKIEIFSILWVGRGGLGDWKSFFVIANLSILNPSHHPHIAGYWSVPLDLCIWRTESHMAKWLT